MFDKTRKIVRENRLLKSIVNSLVLYPLAYAKTFRRRIDREGVPFTIYNIELTNKCPMRCVMCARTHQMTREQGLMDFNLFQRAIDELLLLNPQVASGTTIWLHHFGESLLHPEFDKFIRYLSERGVHASLSLNPIMLTENISRRLIQVHPHVLYFSLDGHDDESFFRIRGMKDAFTKSKNNILRFLELKKELHSPVQVHVSMIDFAQNSASIAAMKKFWLQQEGVDEFVKKDFITWSGDVGNINQLESENVHHARQKKNVSRKKVFCNYPFEIMTILWDGRVVPCCFDYDAKYVLGDLKKQTLRDIWNGAPMKELRRQFEADAVQCDLCKNCLSLHTPHLIP